MISLRLTLIALLASSYSPFVHSRVVGRVGSGKATRASSRTLNSSIKSKDKQSKSWSEHVDEEESNVVLRWVSSGGGWRAMVASMAYANVFMQAGLIDETTSKFSAMNFNSGSAWFATQFFYSQPFFDHVIADVNELSTFVNDWMQAYLDLQDQALQFPICDDPLGLVQLIPFDLSDDDLKNLCNLFIGFGGSWATFTQSMLQATSSSYGDPSFIDRKFDSVNRVGPLNTTDIYVQTTLAPNSRAGVGPATPGENVFLAQYRGIEKRGIEDVFAVPLSAQFFVNQNDYGFKVALDGQGKLKTIHRTAPADIGLDDFSRFHLYPGKNGSVYADFPEAWKLDKKKFRDPFGGYPSVTQVASATSAVLGHVSGTAPSMLADFFSVKSFMVANSGLPLAQQDALQEQIASTLNTMYQLELFHELSVCTQWPSTCDTADGRLVDGGFSDGLGMAMNIGQYQTMDKSDLSKTIKVIATNNNYYTDTNAKFLSYFNTTFNVAVAPGEFIWAPGTGNSDIAQDTPWRSYQIFEEYLDDKLLDACLQTVLGGDMTHCWLNATTVDNPAFGIQVGQRVEILLIQINSKIPTVLIGKNVTTTNVPLLVNMTRDIVESNDLVSIIKSFVGNDSS